MKDDEAPTLKKEMDGIHLLQAATSFGCSTCLHESTFKRRTAFQNLKLRPEVTDAEKRASFERQLPKVTGSPNTILSNPPR